MFCFFLLQKCHLSCSGRHSSKCPKKKKLQNVKYDGYWKHSSSNVAHIKSTLQFKILLGGYDAKCIKNLITSSNTNIIIIVIPLLFLLVVRRWGCVLFTTRWHCTAFSVLTAGGGKTRDAFDWDDQSRVFWVAKSMQIR